MPLQARTVEVIEDRDEAVERSCVAHEKYVELLADREVPIPDVQTQRQWWPLAFDAQQEERRWA